MKKLSFLFLALTALAFVSCSDDDKATLVTSFEGELTAANSEFTTTSGTEIPNSWGVVVTTFKDPTNTLEFSHYYAPWGFAGGFTYCNYNDKTTPGYKNISAITGKGINNNSTYLVSTIANKPKIELLKSNEYIFKGAWVTNSTYAYLAIKDGNDNYKNETKFEDGDWFKLTATGYNSEDKVINKVDFYLADYQNGKNKIVDTWEWFDFSPISTAEYIIFEMTSSDVGEDGMNTPSYFCMDGITLEEK